MKVLTVTTSDTGGGAGKAAYRIHKGLQGIGINSQMLVQHKATEDITILSESATFKKLFAKARPTLDALPLHLYPNREHTFFSTQIFPNHLHQYINHLEVDIIHFHWICEGFIPIDSFKKLQKPLVWTLHDMWALTGGCHYSGGCEKYLKSCGACPQLNSTQKGDLSRWVWHKKFKAWKGVNLTIVTPSLWLAQCAKQSSLLKSMRVEVIPNGLDESLYKPIDKRLARYILNLPQDKKLILFGAMKASSDKRKGFHLLIQTLERLATKIEAVSWESIILGSSQPVDSPKLPVKTNYLGTLHDDVTLTLVYSAVDVFLAPSLEDNLPNTVMESLACGTPAVAFRIGGMPDMIEHMRNGYLAQPFDVDDLTNGLCWILQNQQNYQCLSKNARHTVEAKFTLSFQAKRYSKLYQEIVDRHKRSHSIPYHILNN